MYKMYEKGFSADGMMVASTSEDNVLMLWKMNRGIYEDVSDEDDYEDEDEEDDESQQLNTKVDSVHLEEGEYDGPDAKRPKPDTAEKTQEN